MKSCWIKLAIIGIASSLVIAVAYYYYGQPKPPPVLAPSQINPELVDPRLQDQRIHRVARFELTDQRGLVTDSTFTEGRVHVADYFFTSCKTICPIMSAGMQRVANEFDVEDDLRFLSFSVLPEEDTVPVLAEYAKNHDINPEQWRLLTGDKKDIYELARMSYFTLKPAEAGKGDGGDSDFIHTNNFVLVDRKQRIRGYYDGTSVLELNKLIEDINVLLEE